MKANAWLAEGELDWCRTAQTVRSSSCLGDPHPQHDGEYFLSKENLTSRGAREVGSCEQLFVSSDLEPEIVDRERGSARPLNLSERFARNLSETGITSNFIAARLTLDLLTKSAAVPNVNWNRP